MTCRLTCTDLTFVGDHLRSHADGLSLSTARPATLLRWAFCCPGVDMHGSTHPHHPLLERLVDNAIGASIGATLAVLLWLGTLWLLFH